MPLKFNEAIELLFEDLSKNPTPEQQLYVDDADEISEKINQEFANINSIFKGTITNLNKICKLYLTSFGLKYVHCTYICTCKNKISC